MERHSLYIDDLACWGCKTCEVACKQEMDAPDRVKLIEVFEDGPRVVDGAPYFLFRVHVCRHCDDPPCAEACPAEAIWKRDDGIVVLEGRLCTGCQNCLEACPYHVISFDEERGIARKCNLCHHRVDQGLYPACADNVCLGHCIYFGEPQKIREAIARKHQTWARKP